MLPSVRHLQALRGQSSRISALPLPLLKARMSVRIFSISSILLAIFFAWGLRSYLQTGNESKITDWVSPSDKSGEFKRGQSAFRNSISRKPGAEFPPEKDRYHLYVSYACPWGMIRLIAVELSSCEAIADHDIASSSYLDRKEAQRLGRDRALHCRALAHARERYPFSSLYLSDAAHSSFTQQVGALSSQMRRFLARM
jgi:hypothetical protein